VNREVPTAAHCASYGPASPNSALGVLRSPGNCACSVRRKKTSSRSRYKAISHSAAPNPISARGWPIKHIYVQQSRRQKYLTALVARCNCTSWYHHDIRVIGYSEIVYDLRGRGFHDDAQLWIQTQGKVVNVADPWEVPVQRKRWVDGWTRPF
jgi:hypothetical protein